jgi:hypothetical protein
MALTAGITCNVAWRGAEARAKLPPLLTTACPRGSTARRAAWRDSTGTAKTWQPTVDGLAGHGLSGPQSARQAGTGLPAAGVEGLRPVFPGGWGRSAEMADRLPGFANQSPFHVVS